MKTISRTMYKGSEAFWSIEVSDNNSIDINTINERKIYKSLASDLLAKKVHKCTYINRICDRSNYDGTRTITVYYDNGTKSVYIVEA